MVSLEDVSKEDFKPTEEKIELIPSGFEKNETGIFKKELIKKKDGESELVLIPLTYTLFDITQRLENPDTKEVFFEISFDNKKVNISGADLSNKRGIIKLAGYGLNTTESSAKALCNYMMELKNLNHIPDSLIYDRFGWKEDGSFVLGKTRYTKDGSSAVSLTISSKQTEAIHQKGTLKGWVNAISKMMVYEAQRFKSYVSAAAPLLKTLDEPNILMNDSGDTSTGKTLTTLCAMSMYGEPYDLLFSGNSTTVGMERTVTQFCDMPTNIDDAQMIDKKILEGIIYMLGNGVGKLRGAKEGGTQEVLSWRTAGLFTSEIPVITEESKGGIGARLIEVNKGLGKQDDKAVSLFESEIKNHHGVFAPVLIDYILHHETEIKKTHEDSKKTLERERGKFVFDNSASGIAGRLANTYATVLTAARIFEELYKSIGGEYKDPEPIVTEVFKRNVQKQGAETYTNRGLNHILSWIAANRTNFLDKGVREHTKEGIPLRYKVYGDITKTHYYLIPNELRAELEKARFSIDRLIEDFKDAGYLETDKDQKQKRAQKTHWMEGSPTKTYALIREKIDIKDTDSEKEGKV